MLFLNQLVKYTNHTIFPQIIIQFSFCCLILGFNFILKHVGSFVFDFKCMQYPYKKENVFSRFLETYLTDQFQLSAYKVRVTKVNQHSLKNQSQDKCYHVNVDSYQTFQKLKWHSQQHIIPAGKFTRVFNGVSLIEE